MGNETNNLVVEAIGLTKVFKDFWGRPKAKAVNGVDLSVKQGQVFGLLGPNGSGKSTTIKLILGLLNPTRGHLRIFGKAPRNVDIKRKIGYLPEESYLYKYLTAIETLDFFGSIFNLTPKERANRGEQLLEMVGLSNAKNRPVGEFSKGMARRIGLAQALINDPDLIILDEPTAGLDPIGCKEVKDLVRLLASRGKTIILCSHLLADVQDVCDEAIFLYGGKICKQGRLEDLLRVDNQTRIVTPKLSGSTTDKIKEIIKAELKKDEVKIDSPSMNLEDFFLQLVEEARAASIETAGAQAGGKIAEYLQQEEKVVDISKVVLEAVNKKEILQPSAKDVEEQCKVEKVAKQQEIKKKEMASKLEKLAVNQKIEVDKVKPEPQKKRQEEISKANDKLKDLLGKK